MTYTPNFNDPRVRRRIESATAWARACVSADPNKPHQWGTRYLDKMLGHQTNDLGKYIRNTILIEVNNYYQYVFDDSKVKHNKDRKNFNKQYILNEVGISMLENRVGIAKIPKSQRIKQWATSKWHKEFITGTFNYESKADRLWHPLQRVATDERTRLFKQYGYRHDYDIETAAPTLLYQRACSLNPQLRNKTPHLQAYLNDRTEFRQYVSTHLGTDTKTTKHIITSLFAGATLRAYKSIHEMLNYDWDKLEWIKTDSRICDLRKDIKKMWDAIKPELATTNPLTGRLDRLTSRIKWKEYFRLERCVMDVIRKYLTDTGNRYFSEHDGWKCHYFVDTHELELLVRTKTGYVIKINKNDV